MVRHLYIFIKNPEIQRFLKTTLKNQKRYKAVYFISEKDLVGAFNKRPLPLVIEEGLLKVVRRFKDTELLVIVGRDTERGFSRISEYSITHYILPPYKKMDFIYKLENLYKAWEQHKRLEKEIDLLRTTIDIMKVIQSSLDTFEILYNSVKKISDVLPVSRCSIIKIEDSEKARVVATYEDPGLKNIRLDLKKYPEIRKAIIEKRTVIIKNILTSPLMSDVVDMISPLGIKSIIVIPILYNKKAIGALFLRTSKKSYTFNKEEISLLETIANATASALLNAFKYEKLKNEKKEIERLAITDYLTGLYNYSYMYHRLSEEFEKAVRYMTPFSCIMFDLDGFKSINDTMGHQIGDKILHELGILLKRNVRKTDIVARYGGEEFIILLPHTDMNGAVSEAMRLKRLITEHRFKNLNEPLTASFGISSFPSKKIKRKDDLITFADDALYTSKKKGKNLITVSD